MFPQDISCIGVVGYYRPFGASNCSYWGVVATSIAVGVYVNNNRIYSIGCFKLVVCSPSPNDYVVLDGGMLGFDNGGYTHQSLFLDVSRVAVFLVAVIASSCSSRCSSWRGRTIRYSNSSHERFFSLVVAYVDFRVMDSLAFGVAIG